MKRVMSLGLTGGLLMGMWSVVGIGSPFFQQSALYLDVAVVGTIGYVLSRQGGRRSRALQGGALAGGFGGFLYGMAQYFLITVTPAYARYLRVQGHLAAPEVQAIQGIMGLAFGLLSSIGVGLLLGLGGSFVGSLVSGRSTRDSSPSREIVSQTQQREEELDRL